MTLEQSTDKIREDLSNACEVLLDSVHEFKIMCLKTGWSEKVVKITNHWTEIFPNVMAKVLFPTKPTGNSKTIIIKAKAGAVLHPHKMMPTRWIYVVEGEQRNETGLVVLNEDESTTIKPLEVSTMYFHVDTKLIMEIEK